MSNSKPLLKVEDLVKLQDVRAPNGTWIQVSEDVFSEFREKFYDLQKCGDEFIKSWSEEDKVEVISFNNNLIRCK